ncbi:hypothetical protein DFH27DRAFT_201843 [Peziza echinospora]|nr:hypothetical protein DFH27DRAFT_201843 [Peziza echinospora]
MAGLITPRTRAAIAISEANSWSVFLQSILQFDWINLYTRDIAIAIRWKNGNSSYSARTYKNGRKKRKRKKKRMRSALWDFDQACAGSLMVQLEMQDGVLVQHCIYADDRPRGSTRNLTIACHGHIWNFAKTRIFEEDWVSSGGNNVFMLKISLIGGRGSGLVSYIWSFGFLSGFGFWALGFGFSGFLGILGLFGRVDFYFPLGYRAACSWGVVCNYFICLFGFFINCLVFLGFFFLESDYLQLQIIPRVSELVFVLL